MIDPTMVAKPLEARLAHETDPLFRTQLETVIRHMTCEFQGDIDGVMATLSPEACYYSFTGDAAPAVYNGLDSILNEFYLPSLASIIAAEFRTDRLLVDKGCIMTMATAKLVFPGTTLAQMGIEVDDVDAAYLRNVHGMAVEWPLTDDGTLLLGENVYWGAQDPFELVAQQKVDRSEIVGLAPAA